MSALSLIIQREFTSRIRTRAFLLTTILTPFLFMLVLGLPGYLLSIEDTNIKTVYVSDDTGLYSQLFQSKENYSFVDITGQERTEKMDALLEIKSELSESPLAATFFSEQQQPPRDLLRYINTTLSEAVRAHRIQTFSTESQLAPEVTVNLQNILSSKESISVNTLRWSEDGATQDTLGEFASLVGMFFTFIMMMFIMIYGSMVIQSVVEEKSNRIVEVILSSVKPYDLMMGKIIGVGLTGILQMFIWAVVGWIGVMAAVAIIGLPAGGLSAIDMSEAISFAHNSPLGDLMSVNWLQVFICFVLYFVGGYLLFASLFAMFGSAANDAQEAQQLTSPLMILLFVAFYTGYAGARNPEGSIAFWCSLIPFTSPIVMLVRAPFQVPIWEIILSLVLLYTTAILCAQLAAKVYKTGILMNGKKASFKDLIKWVKYK